MRPKSTYLLIAASALVAVMATGCASSAKLSQFDSFATAGNAYSAAMDGLLTEAGQVLLDTNSKKLIWTAEGIQPGIDAEKAKINASGAADAAAQLAVLDEQLKGLLVDKPIGLLGQDEVMLENLRVMEMLREQVGVLAIYFSQLSALATTDAAEQFGEQLAGTVTALNTLSTDIKGTNMIKDAGGAQKLLQGLGNMIVTGVQVKALERELEARKGAIEEVMKLHEVLLELLNNQIQADLDIIRMRAYETNVEAALLDGTAVANPEGWISDRRELLGPPPLSRKVSTTMMALRKMRAAWGKLLVNELSLADVQAVVADLQPVLAGAASLKSQ